MSHRAVLFDLDGTLIDSVADIAQATNNTLAALGFPTHPTHIYRGYIGDGARNLLLRALPQQSRDEQTLRSAMAIWRGEYDCVWNRQTRLYPGIAELLSCLQKRAIRLTLLSNKPDDFVQKCAGQYLSGWPFAVVMGATERFPHKPDPAAALEVARLAGVAATDFLYVGDMPVDMETACRAGMVSVGVTWGLRGSDDLTAAGAQHIIDAPAELLDIVG